MIAHINNNNKEQTIKEHLLGTAAKAEEKGCKIHLKNLMRLTGLIHDIGKNTRVFEKYIRDSIKDPKSVRRGEVDHSTAGGKFIYESYYKNDQVQKITAQIITTAITSHHGLHDCLSIDGEDNTNRRTNKSGEIYYDEVLRNSFDDLLNYNDLNLLFNEAKKELNNVLINIRDLSQNISDKYAAYFLIGCMERLVLSILIDADRYDTAKFMSEEKNLKQMSKNDTLKQWQKMQDSLNKKISKFESIDTISILRREISDYCLQFSKNTTGIYCLQVPTGGGKTLSGLRYALEHAKIYKKEHIFYVAPYLSILEQNAEEYRKALNFDEFILEHHSNIIADDEDYDLVKETWDSPIILTTMVQFLNVLFSDKTQNIRRMNQLINSVIIIDEIQSLPIKCISIFNLMMNFLTKVCNSTIVLCSATQPLLGEVDKNIIYGTPTNMIKDTNEKFNSFKRVEIVSKMKRGGYNRQELADFIISEIDEVNNILIILNTKSVVRALFTELENIISINGQDIEVVQLTTYMCAENRSDIINNLKEKLKTDKKIICISSQLIEAGVDISFQCVIRSLAGLDNIAQAAGRCNRNGELKIGNVYIINYNEENLSNLKDIKEAQRATQRIIDEINSSGITKYDLLSPKHMDKYYQIYFFRRKNEMDYKLKEFNTSIYNLLSVNSEGQNAYREKYGQNLQLQLKQAFKKAGENFEVINNNTIGLLVPYKNGLKSINLLRNNCNYQEMKEELRKVQRYTVNLYKDESMLKKLYARNAIERILDGQILILNEGFYKDNIGVCSELENLII